MMQTAVQHLPQILPHNHNPHSAHTHIQPRHNNVNIPTPPQYTRQLPISSSTTTNTQPAASMTMTLAGSTGSSSIAHKKPHLPLQPLQLPLPMPTPPNHTQTHAAGPVTRKRKRPSTHFSVTYSEVQEFDREGRMREVIVIEDTPPPPTTATTTTTLSPSVASIVTSHNPGHAYSASSMSLSYQPPAYHAPIRTRARAAAEANAANAANAATANAYANMLASASTSAHAGPATKKRKRDAADDGLQSQAHLQQPVPAKKIVTAKHHTSNNVVQTKSYSGATTEDASKGPPPCDDKEGHYIIVPDDIIYKRYRTIKLLGQGTFGKVVEAVDTTNQQRVAIKIIRAIPKYRDASKIEIRVLQKLKEKDPGNKHKCIHLLDCFDHKNHVCLVSELLGMCIYDFLKDNEFQPFPRRHIQEFGRQLLNSVAFLHDLRLIHTDLKPENILLVRNSYRSIYVVSNKRNAQPRQKRILTDTDIRLIDFGSATFEEEYHSTVVSTRHYRAPEIILGLGWSFPCDVFSLGCILVEFYTGIALFQTHDNLEHLAMMENVMGKMPERFARAGARSKPEFFKEGNRLDWPKPRASRQSKKDVKGVRRLQEIIPPRDTINMYFLDLVQKLLAFDPQDRLTVRQALQHPFFKLPIPMEE